MNKETYDKIEEAYDLLESIETGEECDLRRIDWENVEEAQKQLAWSIRRWGVEFDEGPESDIEERLDRKRGDKDE